VIWEPHGPALLFCPADRPERFEKALAAADMVILDLEDGVGANDKDGARRALIETQIAGFTRTRRDALRPRNAVED
jgi:citrate lyase subunit beta/citryl-CoA lyase